MRKFLCWLTGHDSRPMFGITPTVTDLMMCRRCGHKWTAADAPSQTIL